jgi:hypothetical protein
MTDLVSAFVRAAQSFFVQIRNLEASYSEEMSEAAHAHLTNLNMATITVATELKQVFPLLHIFKFCTHCAVIPTSGQRQYTYISDTPYCAALSPPHFYSFALHARVTFLNRFYFLSHLNSSDSLKFKYSFLKIFLDRHRTLQYSVDMDTKSAFNMKTTVLWPVMPYSLV